MRRETAQRGAVLVVVCATIAAAFWAAQHDDRGGRGASLSPAALLGGGADAAGYARADLPREFRFPEDHAAHPEFQSEWWYWTGVLDGPEGRRFGYQLTFFRFALSPDSNRSSPSKWAANQVYMAHFALTDARGGKFLAFEKVAREALGLAGAAADPFRVWVLDWQAEGPNRTDAATPMHLRAAKDDVAIDLELAQGKPPVLQGDRGRSRKGKAPGNASYYYSLTRMPTRGSVVAGGARFEVRGDSWMDREWSTSALEPDQVGWDWLALTLSDGRELMFFRLRRRDGSTDPNSGGSLVDVDGRARPLGASDVDLVPLGTWQSPRTHAVYPSSFRLTARPDNIDLVITPLLKNQEIDLSFRYWEGAVTAVGQDGTTALGRGYLELTGYGDTPAARAR